MRKFLIIFSLLLTLFFAAAFNSQAAGKGPKSLYSDAVKYMSNLDTDMAYRNFDAIIKDFPKSSEAPKAVVLKAVISAAEFSCFNMLSTIYSEAAGNANTDNAKKEFSRLYMEASLKMIGSAKLLTGDAQDLLKYAGEPIDLEIKKGYDSIELGSRAFLPIKQLDAGNLPAAEEIKAVEDFLKDASYRYILGKMLGDEDLIPIKTVKGKVNWADTMFLMGNELVNCGAVSKAGWLDPSTMKKTRSLVLSEKSFTIAKQCFEKARRLSENQDAKTQADERIKEIDAVLKELKGEK